MALVLLVVALPSAQVRLMYSRRLFRFEQEQTQKERWAWYYHWMLTNSFFAKEVRLFDLGALFRDRFRALRQHRQALRQEVPAVASTDPAWLESQRRRESSLRDIVVVSCVLLREHSSLKAFWFLARNWRRFVAQRREIMARRRVTDEYLASWFSYTPVSRPAPKPVPSALPARSAEVAGS